MVAVLVTQTANWVKLLGIVSVCLLRFSDSFRCFVYGGVLDTINRVPVVRVHGSHPLSEYPGCPNPGYSFFVYRILSLALGTSNGAQNGKQSRPYPAKPVKKISLVPKNQRKIFSAFTLQWECVRAFAGTPLPCPNKEPHIKNQASLSGCPVSFITKFQVCSNGLCNRIFLPLLGELHAGLRSDINLLCTVQFLCPELFHFTLRKGLTICILFM